MKILVSTAEQQFCKRMEELKVTSSLENTSVETLYLCEDGFGAMYILKKVFDNEFYEYKYDCTYSELVSSENFLREMTKRFTELELALKPLFEWYINKEKNKEPFTIDDIWMCDLEVNSKSIQFEDIYEEVDDTKIVTAREQWEEASKNATITGTDEKVEITDEGLVFYWNFANKSYEAMYLPSFEELRKDSRFIAAYIEEVQNTHPEDLVFAIKWLGGEKYTMSETSLWDIRSAYSEAYNGEYPEHIFFCDKTVDNDQSQIRQRLTLTPEQQEAVKMIEEGCKLLKERGGRIISYWDQNEYYVVNGKGLGFDCDYRTLDGYVDISKILEYNHVLNFSWTDYWGSDTHFFAQVLPE